MRLIYCFDAYCGWCYGFHPVLQQILDKYKDDFQVEIISSGMLLPEKPVHIGVTAEAWLEMCPKIEETTGKKFGQDFLWHVQNPELSDWFPSSEKPAIALAIVRHLKPDLAFNFASALHTSLFLEGRDLTDNEAYRHLLAQYELDPDIFYPALESEQFKEIAYNDFALAKQLQVQGLPALLLQISIDKFYLMSSGYLDYETLESRFQNVLAEFNN